MLVLFTKECEHTNAQSYIFFISEIGYQSPRCYSKKDIYFHLCDLFSKKTITGYAFNEYINAVSSLISEKDGFPELCLKMVLKERIEHGALRFIEECDTCIRGYFINTRGVIVKKNIFTRAGALSFLEKNKLFFTTTEIDRVVMSILKSRLPEHTPSKFIQPVFLN